MGQQGFDDSESTGRDKKQNVRQRLKQKQQKKREYDEWDEWED